MVSRLERPRAAVSGRVLHATFENACFANFFFSYAPSGDAIPSRRGQPCVKRMVVVSFEEHDLHMLAASWPAGLAVLRVGGMVTADVSLSTCFSENRVPVTSRAVRQTRTARVMTRLMTVPCCLNNTVRRVMKYHHVRVGLFGHRFLFSLSTTSVEFSTADGGIDTCRLGRPRAGKGPRWAAQAGP